MRWIWACVCALCDLMAAANPQPVEPGRRIGPVVWLAPGSLATVRVTGGPPPPGGALVWSIQNGAIVSGQGTTEIGFLAGDPGTLTLVCRTVVQGRTVAAETRASLTVLPPPRAELFAPARMHVGERALASMATRGMRSYLWQPLGDWAGTQPFDPAANPIAVRAAAPGSFQLAGTAVDLAGAETAGSAQIEVVQGDFANPGGVMAEWGAVTAATLASGRVLLVGEGEAAGLFDPPTGTWRNAAPLAAAHGPGHAETLLGDGRVLVSGGEVAGAVLDTADLYDPATDRWTRVGNLVQARSGHTATLLADGAVLVLGGKDGRGGVLADPERYDPEARRWSILTPSGVTAPAARCWHTATLLNDGRVLIAGGTDGDDHALQEAELFDPADNSWAQTARPAFARERHSATLLAGDGSVLVAGGADQRGALACCERFDPGRAAWIRAADLGSARAAHGAAALPDGSALVAGGVSGEATLGTTERYVPGRGPGQGDGWSTLAPLQLPRTQPVTVALDDGRVLVAGGVNQVAALGFPECCSPGATAWFPAAGGGQVRSGHTATLLGNGTVLMAGGMGQSQATGSAERYDPVAQVWRATGIPMATPRLGHSASLLPDGSVLVAGGMDPESNLLASAERYDPESDLWLPAGAMTWARALHTATVLADGRVLVAGGLGGPEYTAQAAAELFDGSLWTAAAPMGTPRSAATATLLADGTVLVAGGTDAENNCLASAERYDPVREVWLPLREGMRMPRSGHTATLLGNGQVLVVGGCAEGAATATVERYDPASGAWTAAASLKAARAWHTATLVNGKVLVTGGTDLRRQLGSAELYDPALDTWTDGGSLDAPRDSHTATLLPDGATVLVYGGNPLQGNLETWQ